MAIFDTDVLIAALRGNDDAKLTINEAKWQGLKTTSISASELFAGAYKGGRTEALHIREFLSIFEVMPFGSESAEIFGRLKAEHSSRGDTVPELDLLIASIAIANGESLVTRNAKHFKKIRELEVEKW